MYQIEFEKALRKNPSQSRDFYFSQCADKKYLTEKFFKDLPYLLFDNFGLINESERVQQSYDLHKRFQIILKHYLKCDVFLTVGTVTHCGENYFIGSLSDSVAYLKGKNSECSLHCWLTLPSMEIIDLTILSRLHTLNAIAGLSSDIFLAKGDEQKDQITHKPLVAGSQVTIESQSFGSVYF